MKSQARQFISRFNLKHPILQSPMAGASTVSLAASITNSGGLGALPFGAIADKPDQIQQQLAQYNDLVGEDRARLLNMNFFVHDVPFRDQKKESAWLAKYKNIYNRHGLEWNEKELSVVYPTLKSVNNIDDDEIIKLVVGWKPAVVSFHFGLPDIEIIRHLQSQGIAILVSATSLGEFKQLLAAKIDIAVLQGWEAGGHRGNFTANDPLDEQLSTFDLTSKVINYIDAKGVESPPFIVAAGGIVDSAAIQTYLNLGIAAVQMGTVWLPTEHCTISKQHKEAFLDPMGRKTLMTPTISGRNLRTVESPFLKEWSAGVSTGNIPDYPVPYDAFKRLNADYKGNDGEFAAYLAGSGFFRAWKNTEKVDEVFGGLVEGLEY